MHDFENTFSDKQDLAKAAGSHLSTNAMDLRVTGQTAMGTTPIADPGRGQPVQVVAQVVEAFVGVGATVQAQIVTADNEAMNANLTVIQETAAVPVAQLKPGYQFRLSTLPHGIAQRYLGLRYVIAGAATTAGKVTAGLSDVRQTNPTV